MTPAVGPFSSLSVCLSTGADGVEGAGEIKKNDSHSAALLVLMRVDPVEQIEDGILHAHLLLVSKLQWILCVVDLGSEDMEQQPFKGLHNVRCQCYWSEVLGCFILGAGMRHEVFQSTGTLLRCRLRLKTCWSGSPSSAEQALSILGHTLSRPAAFLG